MRRRTQTRFFAGAVLSTVAVLILGGFSTAVAAEPTGPEVLIIAGPSQHPPGTHEAVAGARLLEHLVKSAQGATPIRAEMFETWPDGRLLKSAKTIVFIGDLFPPERMENPDKIKAELGKLMDRGVGMVCIHFATGLRTQHVAEDGDHPLLRWLGGYYSSGCPHHRSVARVCTATVAPGDNRHPVSNGWKEFTFDDEPYWNNYFGKDGMAKNVTPLATSMLPRDNPKKEVVAWAVQRADGGRGVGIVLPHFYRNWKIDDFRMLMINSIFWSAGCEIPEKGVQTTIPDLSLFGAASVDPQPRAPRAKR